MDFLSVIIEFKNDNNDKMEIGIILIDVALLIFSVLNYVSKINKILEKYKTLEY